MEPQFRFCTSPDGTRIAYAIYGKGPPLLYMRMFWWSMQSQMELPQARAYFDAFASRTTFVTFDRRGCGSSSREVDDLSVAAETADIRAVADAAGFDTFTLFGEASAAAACALFAQEHRDHLEQLLLWHPSSNVNLGAATRFREDWTYARRVMAGHFFPDGPVWLQRAFSQAVKDAMSAEMAARRLEAFRDVEFDTLAPDVHCPTVVLWNGKGERRQMMRRASLFPHAELRTLDGVPSAHSTFAGDATVAHAVLESMGLKAGSALEGTAIIFFADVADSTALTEQMGDGAFRERARALDADLRRIVAAGGGTTIDAKTLGDGVLATFASAAQGIETALACGAAGDTAGLPLHLGLHAGDVIREDSNVFGGAVNIAARISGLSAPGELLVSDVVRALARTSAGVTFGDRGEHALKGVADPQRVYAVRRERAE